MGSHVGSPFPNGVSGELELERHLQSELNVTAFIGGRSGRARDTAFLRLDKRRRVSVDIYQRRSVEVILIDVLVVVIKDIVHFRAELQAEPLGKLEVFEEIHVDVPVSRSEVVVAFGVWQAKRAVPAPGVKKTAADWNALCVAHVVHSAASVR